MTEVIGIKLQLFLIFSSLMITGYIFYLIRSEVIDLKYSIVWVISGLLSIAISVFPQIIVFFAGLLGIGLPFNFIYLFIFFFIIIISLNMTVSISRAQTRINKLTQEIALLRSSRSSAIKG